MHVLNLPALHVFPPPHPQPSGRLRQAALATKSRSQHHLDMTGSLLFQPERLLGPGQQSESPESQLAPGLCRHPRP